MFITRKKFSCHFFDYWKDFKDFLINLNVFNSSHFIWPVNRCVEALLWVYPGKSKNVVGNSHVKANLTLAILLILSYHISAFKSLQKVQLKNISDRLLPEK